jgi:hypothetical protein
MTMPFCYKTVKVEQDFYDLENGRQNSGNSL